MNDLQQRAPQQSEIFRHIRPHWFDKRRHSLVPHSQGGISFLLKPVSEGVYDFWVYICPHDIEFSSRQAVKSLREITERGVVPFGTITPGGEPLVESLTRFVINERMKLPSEAGQQLLMITIANGYANKKLVEEKEKTKSSKSHYEEH